MSDYYPQTCPGPLFARPAPAVQTSRTSMQAADSLKPRTLNALQRQVFEFLRTCGAFGATDEEMQTALGMNPSTQRPRRIELVRRGLVVEDGTRATTSRRMASVWRVA